MKKSLFAVILMGIALMIVMPRTRLTAVPVEGCTPAQVATVTNAVFTAEAAACLLLNSGLVADSNAVTELEAVCKISPSLEPYIVAFLTNILAHPEAVAKLKAAALGVPKP